MKNQLLVDGFDEDPLKDVISVTCNDTVTSFNLNIEVRSDTKVYYYRLSNCIYSGFDNFLAYKWFYAAPSSGAFLLLNT